MADDDYKKQIRDLELKRRQLDVDRLEAQKRREEREEKKLEESEKKQTEEKLRKYEGPSFKETAFGEHGNFEQYLKKEGYTKTLIALPKWVLALLFGGIKKFLENIRKPGFFFLIVLIIVGSFIAFNYLFAGAAFSWFGSLGRATVVPLYQGVIDPVLEAVLPGFKENLVKGFRVVLDPESAREEFDPSAAKEVSTGSKGVIFESVSKNRDVYFVGDIVEVSVRAKVYGLNDVSTNVRFSCDDIDSVRPEVSISGVGGDSVVVPADIVKSFFITCRYEGLKFNNPVAKTGIKKMKFKALYSDFVTLAELDAYTLSSSSLHDLEARNIDVFADISDSNLNKRDRTVRPRFSEGPIKLDIELPAPHPLTESAPYQFFVKVINQEFAWKGDVVRVSSLALRITEEIG